MRLIRMNQTEVIEVTKTTAAQRRVTKSVFIVVAHYVALILFLLSVWSGLTIARDQRGWLFLDLLPGMQAVPLWHLYAAVAWGALIAAYSIFYQLARSVTHETPRSSVKVGRVLHTWSVRLLYIFLSVMLLSGLLMWSQRLGSATDVLRQIHLTAAILLIFSLVFHLLAQWPSGLWRRFRVSFDLTRLRSLDRFGLVRVCWVSSAVILLFALAARWWQNGQTIEAPRVEGEITIDGLDDDAQWKKAKPTMISTYYGMNQQQHVPIEIKMINDGFSLYVHARWPDPTKSMRHLPLLKTAQGWRVQQTQFLRSDESEFYEDKLAVMLASSPWDALRSVFLSPGATRGGHRTGEKNLLDVWHWKSVRNHGFANLDDAFFGADLKPIPGQRRYTWGYASDPLWAGSYVENWDYFLTDVVRPLRLPRKPERLQEFQTAASENGAHDPVFGMHWIETQPYHESLDQYPLGTVMPSVVWYHPNEGDRADVRAAGVWKDGFWQLEMARNFETDSNYDLTISNDTYFWFASFDHSQIRHTYHLRPLRLRLEK